MVGFRVGVDKEWREEKKKILFEWKLYGLGWLQFNIEREKKIPCYQLRAFVVPLAIMSDSC